MKTKNIWGVDLKPEFPKKPDVKILNDFSLPIKKLKTQVSNQSLVQKMELKNC